jgi:FAD/FMN-containing dehydrogenase
VRQTADVSTAAVRREPEFDEQHIAWARDTTAAIEPWSDGGGHFNYMPADEPVERLRAAFGEDAFERLRALKKRHDPDNVLRRN